MSRPLSRTRTRQAVLGYLLERHGSGGVFGSEIMDSTDLRSGTVYPILAKLEELGWVVGNWEDQALAAAQKRPARRYYRLTGLGESSALEYCAPRAKVRGTGRPHASEATGGAARGSSSPQSGPSPTSGAGTTIPTAPAADRTIPPGAPAP